MREIQITGNVNCEEECLYKYSCANHASAGIYRSESGFTPELLIIADKFYCNTIDQNPNYGKYETLPVNYDELDRGCLSISFGKLEKLENGWF